MRPEDNPEYNIWHPFTQMKTAAEPIWVDRAEGSWLFTRDGRKLFDGISSWWVTLHGHARPEIALAIAEQAATLEQVIFAGFTHPKAVELARMLKEATPGDLNRVFFSDDGSTAVEVGIKMAWQYWHNRGEQKSRILSLEGAYHGDTFGAMSVSARSVFTKAFDPLLFEVISLPSPGDFPVAETLRKASESDNGEVAAIILEPLVQGAGGMKMYSPEALESIVRWAKDRDILVIFDEIMTGFYRTGTLFAADQISLTPDIMCLSKGLTGGFLPLSVTIANDRIYEGFLSDDRSRALFHGHSFTANPIGCAAAVASMKLSLKPETLTRVRELEAVFAEAVHDFKSLPNIERVRHTGTILAMDMKTGDGGYLSDLGQQVCKAMMQKGFFLRPLGNVLYIMPPLSTVPGELRTLCRELVATLSEFN